MKKYSILFLLFLFGTSINGQEKAAITQSEAWDIVRVQVLHNDTTRVNVFVSNNVIQPNSIVEAPLKDETAPDFCSWFFFIDDMPYQSWDHACRYVFVNVEDGKYTVRNRARPPHMDNMISLVVQRIEISSIGNKPFSLGEKRTNKTPRASIPNPNYALIINGGGNQFMNFIRYWNDCSAVYQTLKNDYDYRDNHIYVLMSDGTSSGTDMYDYNCNAYVDSPKDLDGDGVDDVDYAATKSNLEAALSSIYSSMNEDAELFVFVTGPAGSVENIGLDYFVYLWNEQVLTPNEMAQYIGGANRKITSCFVQNFSYQFGLFPANTNKVITTTGNAFSLPTSNLQYQEFLYHWVSAISGQTPDSGTTVDADYNNDGVISMYEAFTYADANYSNTGYPTFYSPNDLGKRTIFNSIYLSGPLYAFEPETFTLGNLPTGFTVDWSLSDSYFNQYCIQRNYPSQNQCVISPDNSPHYMIDGVLTANVKHNDSIFVTRRKTVTSYSGFWGHYSSGSYSGDINYTHVFVVTGNTGTTVFSPNFYGATVSYSSSGATPTAWSFNPYTGILNFVAPASPPGTMIPVVINVDDVHENNYVLYAFATSAYGINISYGDNSIIITLNENGEPMRALNIDEPCTIEIRNALTGELKSMQTSTSRSTILSTIGLSKGMYVVKVNVGRESWSEKFVKK